MSLTSEPPVPTRRFARLRQVLRTGWATCWETAALIRHGITRPVLVLWALLLILLILALQDT